MSISGTITRYQLACPPSYSDSNDSNDPPLKTIINCYRLNDNESKLPKEAFGLKSNRTVITATYIVTKWNNADHVQSPLYGFEYTIESLSPGIYSIFAYEDCEEAHGSFIHPEKQAFGWSTCERAGKWTQHTIYDSTTHIGGVNITLRKPHSFFAAGYPLKTDTARFHLVNHVPVLQLNATNPTDRGCSHGYLLAPHILDWFYFYLLEENFESIARYVEFYALVDPTSNFFHYPSEYLLEIQGILHGMQARTDCNLFLPELNRSFDHIDLLAMNSYVERRTVKPDPRSTQIKPDVAHDVPNCSQVIVWNSLTADKRIIAGRNMDGECDIRRVTVSTTLLIAVNSPDAAKQYRYISLSWPGLIGSLSGVNETGLYCMENAGPSHIGGQIKGLTPVSYIASHVLRTVDARRTTKTGIQAAFETFVCDPTLNQDRNVWPAERAKNEFKGPVCGPGCVFVLATNSDEGADGFILEGDRYGGRIRTAMQVAPYIPDCLMATNHFHLYGFATSSCAGYHNFGLPVSFSSWHRYESMRHRLEMQFRLPDQVVHVNLQDVRALMQSACEGRTEHAIAVEIEPNGDITLHIYLAAREIGMWYAPYEQARTIRFEDLFF